jgi:hypothetical protein
MRHLAATTAFDYVQSYIKQQTGNSSTANGGRARMSRASSTNGPMNWSAVIPHQLLTEKRLWKCVSVNTWGLLSDQTCEFLEFMMWFPLNLALSVNNIFRVELLVPQTPAARICTCSSLQILSEQPVRETGTGQSREDFPVLTSG